MSEAPERPKDHPRTMRLQRFLARAGVASRRGSENLMTAGRVQVNGQVVTQLGSKVDPAKDVVTVDGVRYDLSSKPVSLILNKPPRMITTMDDPKGRACVADIIPKDRYPGIFPVGRLDNDTTGLLLFTTDGDLAQALLHPSQEKPKTYLALIQGALSPKAITQLEAGVELEDGIAAPAAVEPMDPQDPRRAKVAPDGVPAGFSVVALTIHEGKKHQVKRMFSAVGHPVAALHRESFGPLELGELPQGRWRLVTPDEQAALDMVVKAASEEVSGWKDRS